MSKINKWANLYDKDGNLIRKVDEKTGKLENYTMEELEELVDQLYNDKDEDGKIKNPQALNNVNMVLMEYYRKYGNPHLKDILEKLQNSKSTDEQAQEKLREVEEEIEGKNNNSISENPSSKEELVENECHEDLGTVEEAVEHDGISEEYAEFEEIKDDTEQPS